MTCAGSSCSGSTLSRMACDGAGACGPEGTGLACPGNLGCRADGGCRLSCGSSADCASGFVCNRAACVQPIATGTCTENDDCTSEICGIAGTGNCCGETCPTSDPICGSTACDDDGACLSPDATFVCGPPQSCAGNTQTNAALCDGLGHCTAGTTSCSPFICGPEACKTTCASSADCVAGAFCDLFNVTCCAGLPVGGALRVDPVLGDDAIACCGLGKAMPCATLTHAMSLVGAGPADTIVTATVGGAASGDWTPEGEIYPIALGWRVELKAPGIFFAGPAAGLPGPQAPAIFELTADAGGAESASIVGTGVNPVGIGMGQQGNQLVAGAAISVGPGSTLYLANVSVNGSALAYSDAIEASYSTVVLGQDRSGAVTGPVQIGNDLANPLTDGYIGIECYGCTLSDVPMSGTSSVVIAGQGYDIDAYGDDDGGASISLQAAPILGVAPAAVGFNTCPSKPDGVGVLLQGAVTMSLDHATIQCMSFAGIEVPPESLAEVRTSLTLKDTTIQNTQFALEVFAGSAVVSNSTIRYNGHGVGASATVDLSGGDAGGRNTVVCSNRIEAAGGPPGVSVLNQAGTTLNASNVDWDTPGPDLFSCDSSVLNCTCQIAACTDTPSADGMDAVVIDGGGTIITTGNGLSSLSCALPPEN